MRRIMNLSIQFYIIWYVCLCQILLFRGCQPFLYNQQTRCFCELRRGVHDNSVQLHQMEDIVINHWHRGCKSAYRLCPSKCWRKGYRVLQNYHKMNSMCKPYGKVTWPGMPVIGRVRIPSCGIQRTFDYGRRLCCWKGEYPLLGKKRTIRIYFGYYC
eukprot:TCONS_00025779-protein